MTDKELILLQKAMNQSNNYLEFGTGNSTRIAAETDNIHRITVVESDPTFWKEEVLSIPSVKQALKKGRLTPHLINIGATAKWGYPIDDSCSDQWPMYHSCAFQSNVAYDLILVDGRFRIACILHACLSCPPSTKILIHDFFDRPIYFVVLPFLKLEDQADTLGLFSIKKNKNINILKEYIKIYEKLPGF